MLYRILAVMALFFFAACGGGPRDIEPAPRKPVNHYGTFSPPPDYGASEVSALPDALAGQPAARTVKIGLLVPLSGQAAEVGMALQDAATLALMDRYQNAQAGGEEVRVVLVPKDTKGTPAGAAEAARAVIAAGAELIVGPLFSQNVSVVAPIAKQRGVNVLTFSNNPEVAGDNVFVFGFQTDQQISRVLNYALNRNLANIALLAPNNAYGALVKQSANATMQASGLQLAQELYYNPNRAADAEITQLVNFHAESQLNAVMLPEGGQKLLSTVTALQGKGIGQPGVRFLGTGQWDDPAVLRSGTLAGAWFASSPPERFEAYARRFEEFFGYAPPRISSLAYDALALSASLAMNESGSMSAANLTDPIGYNGPVNGIFRCMANGVCERGLAVLEVMGNGTVKVIDRAPNSFPSR